MSFAILKDAEDKTAVIHNGHWPVGPIFDLCDFPLCSSASQVAARYADWIDLARKGILSDWLEEWFERKFLEFRALGWRDCPKCADNICLPERVCEECFESETEEASA